MKPAGAPASRSAPQPVLFFDGECGLCNRIVRVLLRLDHRGVLRFAPLQSAVAQTYLRTHGLPTEDFDSLVFVTDWNRRHHPEFLLRTDGALAAARAAGGVGRLLGWLRFCPVSWRNFAYRVIARWRYRLMGEWKPRPLERAEWTSRFLD